MIRKIQFQNIADVIRKINKLGKSFGFSVYVLVDERYIYVHRSDGELIFKTYPSNVDKLYIELSVLYQNLQAALLFTSSPRFMIKRKNKHLIYFNF